MVQTPSDLGTDEKDQTEGLFSKRRIICFFVNTDALELWESKEGENKQKIGRHALNLQLSFTYG